MMESTSAATAAAASNTASATTATNTSSARQYFAQVTFRVRAEKLGYGEDLFLIPTTAAAADGGHHHRHRVSVCYQKILVWCLLHFM